MDRRELAAKAATFDYHVSEAQGKSPQYIFIADTTHMDFRPVFGFLDAAAAPGETAFFEGTYGKVEDVGLGHLMLSNDHGQGTPIVHPCIAQSSIIRSLLARDVTLRFNDNPILIEQQKALRTYAVDNLWPHYGLPQNGTAVKFHDLSLQRSHHMIDGLLSAEGRSYQVVGIGHLDRNWMRRFTDTTFVVFSPRTP